MLIGIVGKPNAGKSTFFNALTLANAQVANYPFTTIEANKGVAYVKTRCMCSKLGLRCKPRQGFCIDGYRFIPVEVIDVAGLVPKAHEGRGLGNKFLDDLRQANVLIHVLDASGATDSEGNFVGLFKHDVLEDAKFLEDEIEMWFYKIFERHWDKLVRRVKSEGKDFVKYFAEHFSGLGFKERDVTLALHASGLNSDVYSWSKEDLFSFTRALRKISKPIIIAANKIDIDGTKKNVDRLKEKYENVIPTSAMAELVLKKLSNRGAIKYIPGDSRFEIVDETKLNSKEKKALEIIEGVLKKYGSTGVQECIDTAVFKILKKIVVYPVEDENKFTDKDGNVLPDAFLMDSDSTARDLAFKIHSDIGKGFIAAIDALTKKKLPSDEPLKDGSIVKIQFKK